MLENPIVTVLILTHKRPEFLKRSLESVISQTYKNLEILVLNNNVLNDAWFERTNQIINQFNDSRVKIIDTQNVRPTVARNIGIDMAIGEYIATLDDDDKWALNKIETQLPILRKYDAVLNGYYEDFKNKQKLSFPNRKEYINSWDVLKGGTLGGRLSALIVKSKIIKRIKFEEGLKNSGENVFLLRLIRNGYKVGYINQPLTFIDKSLQHEQLSKKNAVVELNMINTYFKVSENVKKELGYLYKIQLSKIIIGVNLDIKQIKVNRIFYAFKVSGFFPTISVLFIKSYNFAIRLFQNKYH